MLLFRTWRFATPLALLFSLALFASLTGCSSDDGDESETAQGDVQEEAAPGSDIDVTEVVLPEFPVQQVEVMNEKEVIEEKRNRDTPEEYIWRRISVRTFTDFNKEHPERGGWEFHGPYREYYPDTTVQCNGQFIDGQKTGEWTWYYEDGTKSKEATYENGVVSGTVTYWRADQSLQRVESYLNGQKHGRWATYAEDGESLLSEGTFKDGAPDGVFTEWYPSGNKRQEAHFANGQLHGPRTTWFDAEPGEESQVAAEENYTNGKPNGNFAQYSPSGTQLLDIQYEDGERVQGDG